MAMFDVWFQTICQRRAGRLNAALNLILNEIPRRTGLETFCVLCPDRPTVQVAEVVENYRPHRRVLVTDPVCPVTSPEHGQQWTRVRNGLSDDFDAQGHVAKWCANWDDDWLLGPGWDLPETGLPAMLASRSVWSWRLVSAHVWGADRDGKATVNLRQFHDSPLFGRYEKGWRRDETMTNQIADKVIDHVAKNPEAERYAPFYLIDCGTITDEERRFLYRKYAKVGKCDDYTRRYIQEPRTKPLTWVYNQFPDPRDYRNMQLKELGFG
ncbi:MAG: hypothetical protein GTN93_23405 [Anaerolineae bacterium]|nr:hypothetical protein [Anaerolineae bacterium]